MRRIVVVFCILAVCAGVVLAGVSLTSHKTRQNSHESSPMAQAESGAGILMEFSTLGLLGVGVISLYVCRKRKRL